MHPEETQVLVFISQPDVEDTVAQKYMKTYHSKSGLKYFIAKDWFARSVLEKQGYTVNLPEARDLVEDGDLVEVIFSYSCRLFIKLINVLLSRNCLPQPSREW